MGEHAALIYQPSSFHRTMGCPGWGNRCASIPEQPSSEPADFGTLAHDMGFKCLTDGRDPLTFEGRTGYVTPSGAVYYDGDVVTEGGRTRSFKIDEDLCDAVRRYTEHVVYMCSQRARPMTVLEERLSLEWLAPGMFGTGDCIIKEVMGYLDVIDYKNGEGVLVEIGKNVGDNAQTCCYGLMALGKDNKHGVERVRTTIVQPRKYHPDGPIRTLEMDPQELYDWGYSVVAPAVKAAEQPDAPLVAGTWCKWCPALKTAEGCTAQRAELLKAADTVFDQEVIPVGPIAALPLVVGLTGDQLGRLLTFEQQFTPWLKLVKAEAMARLQSGVDAPVGFKRVKGRGTKSWTDEQKMKDYAELLDVDPFVEKLATPAQMKVSLKALNMDTKALDHLITITHGAKIVPVDDPSPTIPSMFDQEKGESKDGKVCK